MTFIIQPTQLSSYNSFLNKSIRLLLKQRGIFNNESKGRQPWA